jgi:hypothetical protein
MALNYTGPINTSSETSRAALSNMTGRDLTRNGVVVSLNFNMRYLGMQTTYDVQGVSDTFGTLTVPTAW